MKFPTFSIVIPVFNAKNYLNQCIDSILIQSYQDFEIILVDDGSTDGSSEICDYYASLDKRVFVIHKTNEGSSIARNVGILSANKDFIMFADSDDFWIKNDGLEEISYMILQNPGMDIYFNNVSYYYPSCDKLKKWKSYSDEIQHLTNPQKTMRLLAQHGHIYPAAAYLKIVKKKFIVDHNIFFLKGLIHGEDGLWTMKLLTNAKKVCFRNIYLYAYRKEVPTSVTAARIERKISHTICCINHCLNVIDCSNIEESYKDVLYSFVSYIYCIVLALLSSINVLEKKEYCQKVFQYDFLLKYSLHKKVKMVRLCRILLGKNVTVKLLHFYIKNK